MGRIAVFEGLIFDEQGEPVSVAHVGREAYYVVNDEGFLRHIPAEEVDRRVLEQLREPLFTQREAVVEGLLQMMGKDDLFTKAMIEVSLDKVDENIEQLLRVGIPAENLTMLGMMGFRIVIDLHGEIVEIAMPATPIEE